MIQSKYPIKCKFCEADIIYNAEIKAFCNYGGQYDGLIHRDKTTGNQIEEINTVTNSMLDLMKLNHDDIVARIISIQESLVLQKRDLIDLRKAVLNVV